MPKKTNLHFLTETIGFNLTRKIGQNIVPSEKLDKNYLNKPIITVKLKWCYFSMAVKFSGGVDSFSVMIELIDLENSPIKWYISVLIAVRVGPTVQYYVCKKE